MRASSACTSARARARRADRAAARSAPRRASARRRRARGTRACAPRGVRTALLQVDEARADWPSACSTPMRVRQPQRDGPEPDPCSRSARLASSAIGSGVAHSEAEPRRRDRLAGLQRPRRTRRHAPVFAGNHCSRARGHGRTLTVRRRRDERVDARPLVEEPVARAPRARVRDQRGAARAAAARGSAARPLRAAAIVRRAVASPSRPVCANDQHVRRGRSPSSSASGAGAARRQHRAEAPARAPAAPVVPTPRSARARARALVAREARALGVDQHALVRARDRGASAVIARELRPALSPLRAG